MLIMSSSPLHRAGTGAERRQNRLRLAAELSLDRVSRAGHAVQPSIGMPSPFIGCPPDQIATLSCPGVPNFRQVKAVERGRPKPEIPVGRSRGISLYSPLPPGEGGVRVSLSRAECSRFQDGHTLI